MALSIKASLRQELGKNANRRVRLNDHVPANLVVPETNESLSLELSLADVRNVIKARALHVDLDIETVGPRKAVVKEIKWNPLTDEILHVDLMHAPLGTVVKAEVPIAFKGSSEVTIKGGTLVVALDKLPVMGLTEEIPENILVDVATLQLNSFVAVKDLVVPKGVKILSRPDQRVCVAHVARNKVKDTEAEAAAAVPGAPGAPGAVPAAGAAAPAAAGAKPGAPGAKAGAAAPAAAPAKGGPAKGK
jgi:large subunit ribosomal protein L25